MQERQKLEWVQALRGIAALLVVLAHSRDYLSSAGNFEEIKGLLIPGAMGVDLFFIISGFIMFYTTRDNDGTWTYAKSFAIKRISRIWPTYAAITFVWVLLFKDSISFFLDTGNALIFLKSIFFIPVNYSEPFSFGSVIPLGWTLIFEMFFYLVVFISLLSKRSDLLLGAILALLLVAIPMLLDQFTLDPKAFFYKVDGTLSLISNPLIFEFLAGAVIGWAYTSRWVFVRNKTVLWGAVLISGSVVVWYCYAPLSPYTKHGIMGWGGVLFVFFLSVAIASKTLSFSIPRPFIWIGEISFSLYLTHMIARAICDKAVASVGLLHLTHSWTYVFLTTVASLFVAAISHELLENRASSLCRKLLVGAPTQKTGVTECAK